MWSCQYDENLNNNVFFHEIYTNHHDILKRASQENWIICIPRAGTLEPRDITTETVLDHILLSTTSDAPAKPQITSLSKKLVHVSNREIYTTKEPTSKPIKILFEETFYWDGLKCTLLCLHKPLFVKNDLCHGHHAEILETLHDCIDFLWGEELGHVLGQIQELCWNFINQNKYFETEDLQTQKDLIGSLYSQCLQVTLRNRNLPNDQDLQKLKFAVETYMQSCFETTLIRAVNTVTCFSDGKFNKILRYSSDLQLEDLSISNKFCDIIISAKTEMSKINIYHTILDKISCLKNTFAYLYSSHENICITSDEVLQIFIFLIIKTNVTNWISNLVFLTQFNFSSLNVSNETSFIITTLEAAVEFIKSKNIKPSQNLIDAPVIFQTISNNDLTQLKELLDYKNKNNQQKETFCHPLCDCTSCSTNKNNINCANDISVTNNKGQNLLIIATILNRSHFVEFLISRGIDVNYQDYYGKTALHYANLRGYQDILLILINSKCNSNIKDNNLNTALHLSCSNGHENCVKALLYTCKILNVNSTNKFGETPLHLAVKNNFLEIAKILLENQASVKVLSKKHQSPCDLSQNFHMDKLLGCLDRNCGTNVVADQNPMSDNKTHGIRPKSVPMIKKVDLLLKAIENNDFPLTCFYLGFSNSTQNYDWKSKCHPLCNCEKCEDFQESTAHIHQEPVNVNFCNVDGFTPLHFAAKYGRIEILRILLDSQALVNSQTYKTLQTPLHFAAIYQHFNIIKELIKCTNCEVDCQDYQGNTALYYVCVKNDSRIVEVLLNNGADANVKNYLGQTVIRQVQEKRLFGVLKLLKKHTCEDFL